MFFLHLITLVDDLFRDILDGMPPEILVNSKVYSFVDLTFPSFFNLSSGVVHLQVIDIKFHVDALFLLRWTKRGHDNSSESGLVIKQSLSCIVIFSLTNSI